MFRRLNIPAYTGGLPAGYEYLNNADAGDPAEAYDAITVGYNIGSLFIGHLESAESRTVNRGLKALGENTDYLDDLLRRDMAVQTRTEQITSVGETFYTLPAGTYLGRAGFSDVELLFRLVEDSYNDEISTSGGAQIRALSVTLSGGDTLGGGFSQNPVRVNFNGAVPAATKYRIYHATRGNMATALSDLFVGFDLLTGVVGTSYTGQREIRAIKGGGVAWDAAPLTTLYDLGWGGLNERVRRKTTRDQDADNPGHPVAIATNTAGSGAWFSTSGSTGLAAYDMAAL